MRETLPRIEFSSYEGPYIKTLMEIWLYSGHFSQAVRKFNLKAICLRDEEGEKPVPDWVLELMGEIGQNG